MSHIYAIDGIVPVIDPTAFVHPAATVIGDVLIGPRAYVGPSASLRGDFGRIVVGAGVNIQDCCVLHSFPGDECVVEEDGHIGHAAVLHGCKVRRDALVGMNATVLDHAEIGEGAIVAAAALVKAGFAVPPGALVAGVPAKIVRVLAPEERANKHAGTRDYHRLVERCHRSFVPTAALPAADAARLARRIPVVAEGRPLGKSTGKGS